MRAKNKKKQSKISESTNQMKFIIGSNKLILGCMYS